MRPKISVVIPVYNRAHSVLPTLQSVQTQTFSDFECIVVDDGSKDGDDLRKVVEGLDDSRFHYVRRENGGGGAARNTGIDEAKGEFVAFLDSDDEWLPEKLERDASIAEPGAIVFSQVIVERGGRTLGKRPSRGPAPNENISEYLTCHQGWTQTSTVVVPRSIKARFNTEAKFGQDTDFALRLAHEGLTFRMHPDPKVIMHDDEGDRVSRNLDWKRVSNWLDGMRSMMTTKAYWAYRGWHIARLASQAGHRGIGLKLYIDALVRGALPPSLLIKALGQVLVPRSLYRRILP